MWLVVGIISCSWCCTKKTLLSWEKLFTKCCGFWSGSKKPPTPVFPKVAYHPASDDSRDGVNIAPGGYIQEGAPLMSRDNRRIVIGSQDSGRIVL